LHRSTEVFGFHSLFEVLLSIETARLNKAGAIIRRLNEYEISAEHLVLRDVEDVPDVDIRRVYLLDVAVLRDQLALLPVRLFVRLVPRKVLDAVAKHRAEHHEHEGHT
jgi:hypothetical protein